MNEEIEPRVTEETEATEESKEMKDRFRIERVAYIVVVGVIAGIFWGTKTDLGIFGLMIVVALVLGSLYFAVNFLLGVGGGFSESIPVDEEITNFDWKRFAREPLYFLVVCIAGLILGAIKWALDGGN